MPNRFLIGWICLMGLGCAEPVETQNQESAPEGQDTVLTPDTTENKDASPLLDNESPDSSPEDIMDETADVEPDSLPLDGQEDMADTGDVNDGEIEDTADEETSTDGAGFPCLDDPGCTGPAEVSCAEDNMTILQCQEVEFACFKWVETDTCQGDTLCQEGKCVPACTATCPTGWCGDDGCGGECGACLGGDQICFNNWCELDGDGDGTPAINDCDDGNPQINPEAEELLYDGKDNDCDPSTSDGDGDGDGAICTCMGGLDCDDEDENIGPQILDMVGDELDLNCDGHDGVDGDGDAYASELSGGLDCDDQLASTNPGTGDVFGDGVDSNCDGVDGFLPPPLPNGEVCTIGGIEGDIVSCPLGVARYSAEGPQAVALSGSFSYHASKLIFLGATASPCIEESCEEAGEIPSGSALGTGHQLVFSPAGTPEDPFKGKVGWTLLHPSEVQTPLSDAIMDPNQTLTGNPSVLWLRFQLLQDLGESGPLPVVMLKSQGMNNTLQMKQTTVDDGLIVIYP